MVPLPDSATSLTGLFGYPVSHSISPRIHNAAFRASGLNFCYLAFEVHPRDLKTALAGSGVLGMAGLNITIPHKEEVISFLDEISEEARLIGAVNTISFEGGRSKGFNTDGAGFISALREEKNFSVSAKSVSVIGAGGAGRAIAVQSAREGAARISITDLDDKKARDLSRWVNSRFRNEPASAFKVGAVEAERILGESELVVDATPVGLRESDPPSFDPALIASSALVVDLVYNPPRTALLRYVEKRGVEGMNGLGMLVHQAARSWEIWTGRKAPLEVMKDAARSALSGIQNGQHDF